MLTLWRRPISASAILKHFELWQQCETTINSWILQVQASFFLSKYQWYFTSSVKNTASSVKRHLQQLVKTSHLALEKPHSPVVWFPRYNTNGKTFHQCEDYRRFSNGVTHMFDYIFIKFTNISWVESPPFKLFHYKFKGTSWHSMAPFCRCLKKTILLDSTVFFGLIVKQEINCFSVPVPPQTFCFPSIRQFLKLVES